MIFSTAIKNKSFTKIFWYFHLAWWSVITLIDLFRHIEGFFTETSIEVVLFYFYGSLTGLMLHFFFMRINHKIFSMSGLLSMIVSVSIVGSYLWNWIELTLGVFLEKLISNSIRPASSIDFFGFPFFLAALLVTYSGMYFTIRMWIEWVNQKSKTEHAMLMAQQAQMEMLRYQLNPHFLFNSLSSLRALVESDKAEEMITKLSEFLRYTLDETTKNEVPLIKEIELTQIYFDIEKVRFGDQLIVNYNIEHLSEDYPVPSFILNPLIENAVKHGFNTSKLPLQIDINTAVLENDQLMVEVINTGSLKNDNNQPVYSGTKTGIENVKKRLEFLYPDAFSFELFESEGRVHAKIILNKNLKFQNG